jgi:hypothetical protein
MTIWSCYFLTVPYGVSVANATRLLTRNSTHVAWALCPRLEGRAQRSAPVGGRDKQVAMCRRLSGNAPPL